MIITDRVFAAAMAWAKADAAWRAQFGTEEFSGEWTPEAEALSVTLRNAIEALRQACELRIESCERKKRPGLPDDTATFFAGTRTWEQVEADNKATEAALAEG